MSKPSTESMQEAQDWPEQLPSECLADLKAKEMGMDTSWRDYKISNFECDSQIL